MVGFNPSNKYAQVKLDHFPRDRGENKKYLKAPTRWCFQSFRILRNPSLQHTTKSQFPKKIWVSHLFSMLVNNSPSFRRKRCSNTLPNSATSPKKREKEIPSETVGEGSVRIVQGYVGKILDLKRMQMIFMFDNMNAIKPMQTNLLCNNYVHVKISV